MNKQEVIATLNRIGIKPNKLKGQNFLVDEKVLQTIIETSGAGRGSTVVEVGPGLGVLTEALLKAGARVIALEQERQFVEYLRKKFDGSPLSVLAGNAVLKIPELKLPPEYAVVSNLPYSITSPVINLFLTRVSPRPMSLTLMVQGEVAERLTAPVGSSKRGILTVLIEMLGSARLGARVSPASFYRKWSRRSLGLTSVVRRRTWRKRKR